MRDPYEQDHAGLLFVLAVLFLALTVGAAVDLYMDRPETLLDVHVAFEVLLLGVSLGAATYLTRGWYRSLAVVRSLEVSVREGEAERDQWRDRAHQALGNLAEAIEAQLEEWELTKAERQTAFLLLKGHSHKRIGRLTGRSHRTVRQHAVAVSRKAGVTGRAELSAFFLGDLPEVVSEAPPEAVGEVVASGAIAGP
jgi:DNA-binding CsgD family transcriptional regulator